MTLRVVKLLCVNNTHVQDFSDTGIDRNGDPTSNRQALMRVLEKRVIIDGKRVPTFLLACPPSSLSPAGADDPFDERVLRDGAGEWLVASPAWLAIRKVRSEERAARAGVHEQAAQAAQAQQVTTAMVDLARSMSAQPARSMPITKAVAR